MFSPLRLASAAAAALALVFTGMAAAPAAADGIERPRVAAPKPKPRPVAAPVRRAHPAPPVRADVHPGANPCPLTTPYPGTTGGPIGCGGSWIIDDRTYVEAAPVPAPVYVPPPAPPVQMSYNRIPDTFFLGGQSGGVGEGINGGYGGGGGAIIIGGGGGGSVLSRSPVPLPLSPRIFGKPRPPVHPKPPCCHH